MQEPKKRITCNSLQTAIFLAPNEIRTCCKRFHVENKIKGDAVLIKETGNKVSLSDIYANKRRILEEINDDNFGKTHQCYGCPWLREEEEGEKITTSHISIEHTSVCNMRCTYCSETYYGGEKAKYNVLDIIKEAQTEDVKNMKVVFGGGEPVLNKDFEDLLDFSVEKLKANIRVFTNSSIYSQKLNDYINKKKVSITTSIDAGTEEIFNLVRGLKVFNKVWDNLKKYAEVNPSNVYVKYIFTELNDGKEQIKLFLQKVKKEEMTDCIYQISSDFKAEELSETQLESIELMRKGLQDLQVKNIVLDDHLAPRLLSLEENEVLIKSDKKFIVWGAGEHAKRIFERFGVERVEFFVDKYRKGNMLLNKSILDPKEILNREEKIFIASVQAYSEIAEEICAYGCSDRLIKR